MAIELDSMASGGKNEIISLPEGNIAIGSEEIPETGINEEAVASDAPIPISEPYVYKRDVKPDREPFPADGLANTALSRRYGFQESTSRTWWKNDGKHIVIIAQANELIKWDGDRKKWFLVESN